jgi:hypothetical protein
MTLEIEEGQRQLILLALAILSLERPGFHNALNTIALKIDNNVEGAAEMYHSFRRLNEDKYLKIEV